MFQSRLETYPKQFIEIIKTHLQELEQGRINTLLPTGYTHLMNSIACRSAIMFGDVLSRQEALEILKKLAQCDFPFQCAHGRPSMAPLDSIQSL